MYILIGNVQYTTTFEAYQMSIYMAWTQIWKISHFHADVQRNSK